MNAYESLPVWCSWCQQLRGSAETVKLLRHGERVVGLHACQTCRTVYRLRTLEERRRDEGAAGVVDGPP